TLEVEAEEQPGDVARQQVRFAVAVQEKAGGGACLRIGAVGGQNLTHQLVVGLVRGEGSAEVVLPRGKLDVLGRAPLHEQHVEDVLQPAGVLRAGEKTVDQMRTLIRSRIGEGRAGLGGGGGGGGGGEMNR